MKQIVYFLFACGFLCGCATSQAPEKKVSAKQTIPIMKKEKTRPITKKPEPDNRKAGAAMLFMEQAEEDMDPSNNVIVIPPKKKKKKE